MKKVFLKDSIKMFKNNFFRFICIIIILVLGTAFFMGMNTVAPAMRKTSEDYLKNQNIYDFSLVSNLGYIKDDINKISENENVSSVQGIYEYDTLAAFDSKDIVVRVISTNNESDINNNKIIDGRNIENDDECLISLNLCKMYGYDIGDKIKLYRQDDSKVEDNLNFSEFKIVGKTISPAYLSQFNGNTTLLNGELNGFIIVNESVFKMKNYNVVYVKTNTDNNIEKFSDEYKEKIDALLSKIEEVNKDITNEKYNKIYNQADINIKNGENELLNANKHLLDSKSKIKESQLKLNSSISRISKNVADYYDANLIYSRISEKKDSIVNLYKTLEELEKASDTLEEEYLKLMPKVIELKDELYGIESKIDKNLYEIYELKDESSRFIELNKDVNEKYYEYYSKNETYKKINDEYESKKKEVEENQEKIIETKEQIKMQQQELYNSFSSIQDLIIGMNDSDIVDNMNYINKSKNELLEQENSLKSSNLEEKINDF